MSSSAQAMVPHAQDTAEVTAPVTLQQQRFYLLDRLFPGNPAYNIAVRWGLTGKVDPVIIERCVNEIIRRHQILRTRFEMRDGRPVQIVEPFMVINVPVIDLRHFDDIERRSQEESFTVAEARRVFDLTTTPLIRALLLRLSDQQYVLLVTVHHSVFDGWSVGVFVDELAALYPAFAEGLASPLPEITFNYAEYAIEQLGAFQDDTSSQLEYWKQTLAELPRFELEADHPRPAVPTSNGAIASMLLPRELTTALSALSAKHGATLFMTALVALNAMLHWRTRKKDIVLGTPVAGRKRVQCENLIGLFINVLVLRSDLSGDPTFVELLARSRKTVLGALTNQDLPFERLVDELRPRRSLNLNPLFSVNFIYQRAFVRNQEFHGIALTDIPSVSPGALYDLNFFMVERVDGWRASCEYNTNLYDTSTVERMLEQFRAILACIAANPAKRLSELIAEARVMELSLNISRNGSARTGERNIPALQAVTLHGGNTAALPRNQLEADLVRLWKEALGIDEIRIDEDLFDLGATSLRAVALLPRISKVVGKEVPLMTIFASPTIERLARALAPDRPAGASSRTVSIQPIGRRPPFFFVETEPRFLKLQKFFAPNFVPDQPILSPIADETLASERPYDLRKNACYHVDTILSVQPNGPYYLGGYSAGGIMAYEIAQQLWARGCEVGLLVLFDTPNPRFMGEHSAFQRFKARQVARLAALRRLRLREMPASFLGKVMERMRTIAVVLRRRAYKLHLICQMHADDPPEDIFWARRYSAQYYEPAEYPGRALLFKGTSLVSGRYLEPTYGWGHLVKGGLEISIVQSGHLDLFDEENIGPIAVTLRSRLSERQSENVNPASPSAPSVNITPSDGFIQFDDASNRNRPKPTSKVRPSPP
jgi:thioesterase domain-containing protein